MKSAPPSTLAYRDSTAVLCSVRLASMPPSTTTSHVMTTRLAPLVSAAVPARPACRLATPPGSRKVTWLPDTLKSTPATSWTPSPRHTCRFAPARLPPTKPNPAGRFTDAVTSNAPPPPLFSMAVARRSTSPPSMPVTEPSTAARSVSAPPNGTPPAPGAAHVPVVPVTVPWVAETTPWRMSSDGSATELMTTVSADTSGRWARVVVWLDCTSTSSARRSANGWSPTRSVNSTSMRLPFTSAVAKLPKSKTTELPGPLATPTIGPGLVFPAPSAHWPVPPPWLHVMPDASSRGCGR